MRSHVCLCTCLSHNEQLLSLSIFLMCFNIGFAPDCVFTLQECSPGDEGSVMAASSVFCYRAFAISEKNGYWGVLPWQHRMELCRIVALRQGLSLRVSRVCSQRVNHAYQLSVSLQAVCKAISRFLQRKVEHHSEIIYYISL